MARNYDAIPLNPTVGGCSPVCPPGPKPAPISPVISVSSVNGESGDVVLKNLTVGMKEYNGSNEVTVTADDLGLGRAVVYIKAVGTKEKVLEELADAQTGDLYLCKQDRLFYLSVGEGEYKTFVSGLKGDEYALITETASRIALEVDANNFKLLAKLFDKFGNLIYTSAPVDLPAAIKDVIKRGYYDPITNELVFVLQNDTEIRVPMQGIFDNLQPKITETNKLAFRLVEGLPEFKAEITQNLATEIEARTSAIANEAVTRANADTTEREERIAADQALQTAINNEATTRETADNTLTYNLNQEIDQRKYAFDLLKQGIEEEAEERVKVDAKLNKEIADRTLGDTTLDAKISNETAQREAADNTLTDLINAEKNTRVAQVIELRNSIANETNARVIRDAELADLVDDEKAARESNDELLAAQIQKEVSDRTAADDAEKVERIAGDSTLNTKIEAETAARVQGDADLTTALRNEINARAAADTILQSNIDVETAARVQGDADLNTGLRNEINARVAADADLQAQIDAIPVYNMVKDENPGEYAAIYHLTKDGVNIGEPINIKKDFLVKSASVKTVIYPDNPYPGAKPGDKYIDFVVNTKEAVDPGKEEHIYVPVNSLVDIYTAGTGIAISSDNKISINDSTLTRLSDVENGLNTEKINRISADNLITENLDNTTAAVNAHILRKDNPHQVTKAQVGLGNVDNTADINKPVSTAQQTAINAKAAELQTVIDNTRTALETSIGNEATARATGDSNLLTAIDAEVTIRQTTDNVLQANIEAEASSRADAVQAEATARTTEDTALWAAINALNNKISAVAKEVVCDGTSTTYTITHNLDTYNVLFQMCEKSTGVMVLVDNARVSANTITITFKDAPAAGTEYMAFCYGIPMTYTLIFNNNGGSGTMPNANVIKGIPHIMEECTYTPPENKQFDKWAIGSAEGTKVAAGEAYTFNMDTNIYATWKSSEPNFFYGTVSTAPPTTIEGMTGGFANRDDLLRDGYTKVLPVAEGQKAYEAIAFDNTLNLRILKVENYEFGQWNDVTEDFASTILGTRTVCYHLNKVTGPTEANYRFTFVTKE